MPQDPPFTIGSVAKTLADFKTLPREEQAIALLRRLGQMFPKERIGDGPHKQNLLLPNDPYSLAAGVDRNDSYQLIQHLLGSPWSRLVNEGFLIEPSGNGFYAISDEGWGAIESAKRSVAPASLPAVPEANATPTAFISYSWDSAVHKAWVMDLASKLHSNHGVNVIFDQWDLYPGMDRTVFMEEGIAAADFVLVVCTSEYARKSNSRKGGVGYEAMILSSQLAKNISQGKFIPVLRAGEWDSAMPTWIESKIGVDLRGEPYDENEYRTLLRVLHKAVPKRPPIGPRPDFTDDLTPVKPAVGHNAVSADIESRRPTPREGQMGQRPKSKILKALSQENIWTGPRGMTGGGYPLVRTAELANFVSMPQDYVASALRSLHKRGLVGKSEGTFSDPSPQWFYIPE